MSRVNVCGLNSRICDLEGTKTGALSAQVVHKTLKAGANGFNRIAKLQDAAAIAHVHVRSWLTTYRGIVPDDYLASLNEAERVPLWQDWLTKDISVFLAEIDGKVVGFAGGGAIRQSIEDYDSELYTLYLLQEAQGFGIGKDLLGAVMQALAEKDYAHMLVWVLEANPAVQFYQRTGAQRVTSKKIEIGGAQLSEVAFGWPMHCAAQSNESS